MKLSFVPPLLLLLLLLLANACGGVCSDISVNGIGVILKGAVQTDESCKAVVTIQDGSYTETLPCYPSSFTPEDCLCQGAWDRAGTYTVTVTDGGVTKTQVAHVKEENCHVKNVAVEF